MSFPVLPIVEISMPVYLKGLGVNVNGPLASEDMLALVRPLDTNLTMSAAKGVECLGPETFSVFSMPETIWFVSFE